jgi:hypothetical protein
MTAVVPARAQNFVDSGFGPAPAAAAGPTLRSEGFVGSTFGRRGDPRHHRRMGGAVAIGGWGWYDPDVNRSWDSDSFNDWWHDRPDRAYPRWVQHNDTCAQVFWAGGTWRCSL